MRPTVRPRTAASPDVIIEDPVSPTAPAEQPTLSPPTRQVQRILFNTPMITTPAEGVQHSPFSIADLPDVDAFFAGKGRCS
jgi:hypothetical protein